MFCYCCTFLLKGALFFQRYVFNVLTTFELYQGAEWKPHIDYYDYMAQSAEKAKVSQSFAYVKVSRLFC
jgi:hypothetical protein